MRFRYCQDKKIFIKDSKVPKMTQATEQVFIDIIAPKIIKKDGVLAFDKGVLDVALSHKGIDRETYNKVREFDNLYISATAAAFGLACNNEAKSTDLQAAVADVEFGGSGSKVEIMWNKTRDVPADIPKSGEKPTMRTAYGYTRVKVTRADERLAVKVARNIIEQDATKHFANTLTAAVLA